MRLSSQNRRLSAYEELCGPFDKNKTPMTPLGTTGLAFIDSDKHNLWQAHAVDVYYIGQAHNH